MIVSKVLLKDLIANHLKQENGLNKVLEFTLNAMMKHERRLHLEDADVGKAHKSALLIITDRTFANHRSIRNTLDANVYFARPDMSQDKGTVENRIGVLEFFPKGSDLRDLPDHYIRMVERYINNRPIRKFGYL